jgi:hypothetical protein
LLNIYRSDSDLQQWHKDQCDTFTKNYRHLTINCITVHYLLNLSNGNMSH